VVATSHTLAGPSGNHHVHVATTVDIVDGN
jgi:hypothetical protein